jgi:putative methionine-R-sulfoxide reductase with GAF domain
MPINRLTKKQKAIVGSIKSALCIPIRSSDKIIGVLCMDSKENIPRTLFTNEDVYTFADACAKVISGNCFENGVSPK